MLILTIYPNNGCQTVVGPQAKVESLGGPGGHKRATFPKTNEITLIPSIPQSATESGLGRHSNAPRPRRVCGLATDALLEGYRAVFALSVLVVKKDRNRTTQADSEYARCNTCSTMLRAHACARALVPCTTQNAIASEGKLARVHSTMPRLNNSRVSLQTCQGNQWPTWTLTQCLSKGPCCDCDQGSASAHAR